MPVIRMCLLGFSVIVSYQVAKQHVRFFQLQKRLHEGFSVCREHRIPPRPPPLFQC